MKTEPTFRYLREETELREARELMRELRPHLAEETAFLAQIARQFEQHYRLLGAWFGAELVGLAGFRLQENLLYGRFVYVDDLVVAQSQRQHGIGAKLLDAVRREAIDSEYTHLVLDTGLHMPLAQRFYFREGLLAKGMHFVQPLRKEEQRHA
ncbi:GCN5 family acetyltransferase [Stutzerimonas stutzeri]|uniref:GCN5 family acetyltransferase n=1 Tax=Stutzerimonas stutzeri TaxID=316 RepID=W8QYT8_STUST|nr:GNAT family N-acetyltransferase [Stutzerimonas stutzeri]AHL75459.1 GCN5 family acetyltransferase [Stutzerimonas stutzeri]MCQ4327972.1 GNAT family N-acetyltransferase [Stutzerimonas stutzeri]